MSDFKDFDFTSDERDERERAGEAVPVRCYKCTAGCVHFEFANMMLTFTRQQFLVVSEVIAAARSRLLDEQEPATQVVESVVM